MTKRRFSYPSITPELHYKPAENHESCSESEHSHILFLTTGTALKQNWINGKEGFFAEVTGALLTAVPSVTSAKEKVKKSLMAKFTETLGPWFLFTPGYNGKSSRLF